MLPLLLLPLLGVLLCSLAGSSQVLPQADFSTQAVGGSPTFGFDRLID